MENTNPDDKENTSEYRTRHGVQDNEERPGHGSYDSEPHKEVRDALLSYFGCDDDGATDFVAFSLLGGDYLELCSIDCEGICMYRRLLMSIR